MDVSSFFISIVAIWGSICLLVVGFQLFGLRDSWVVWAPPLVGGLMQGAVVVLGVFFLCCRGERRAAVVRMSSREFAALSYQRYG